MSDTTRRACLLRLGAVAALLAMDARSASAARGAAAADPLGRVDELMGLSRRLLVDLAAPPLAPFLAAWPTAAARRQVPPESLPVLRWLPGLDAAGVRGTRPLVRALVSAAPLLAWRRSYSRAEAGADFLDNYGWTELAGLTGPVAAEHLACGVLLLGPGVTYPLHQHEAEEIYVPLAGTAAWRKGTADWRDQPPGSVIVHRRHVPHAMRTGATPLLALYLWRSADLAQKAHFVAPAGG